MRRRRAVLLAGLLALLVAAGALARTTFVERSMAKARLDAARELASVVLPVGARKVRQDPSVHRALAPQGVACIKKYVVEDHGFWRVAGQPASVWTWMREHRPQHTRTVGSSTLEQNGQPLAWYITFFLPDQPEVTSRLLSVALRPPASGGSAIRVDAIAVGEPRPRQSPCVTAGG